MALAGVSTHGIEPAKLFAIQKGPLLLKPQLSVSTTYTDNINYRESDEVSDFFATISPGFVLQLGALDYNHAELSYLFDRLQYFEANEFDANQHHVDFKFKIQKSRFTLEGTDRFKALSSPLGGGYSIAGEMVDRNILSDHYRLHYDFTERTGIYTELAHDFTDYQDDVELYDTRSLIGTLGFAYKAFSRTFIFGELYYGQTENDQNAAYLLDYPTATFLGGFLGVRGQFTEKLSGIVKVGLEAREYENAEEGSIDPVVEASLQHRFSERTTASLVYSREQEESAQFVSNAYIANTISGNLIQEFGTERRMRGILQAAYTTSSYEQSLQVGERREDDLITAGLTFQYDIKLWMRLFGGYTFEWLDSTARSIADYQVNRLTMGIELGY